MRMVIVHMVLCTFSLATVAHRVSMSGLCTACVCGGRLVLLLCLGFVKQIDEWNFKFVMMQPRSTFIVVRKL